MKKLLFLLFGFLALQFGYSQKVEMNADEKKLFELMNEARTNPKMFLKTYSKDLANHEKFKKDLESFEPIEAFNFNEILQTAAEKNAKGDLNPFKDVKTGLCGSGISSSSGTNSSISAFSILVDYSSNILNPSETDIGIYFDKKSSNFNLCIMWGQACGGQKKYPFIYNDFPDTTKVDFKAINTASKVDYMNAGEIRMIKEINFARVYPKIYADIIGQRTVEYAKKWGGISFDELKATNELIAELKSMEQLKALTPSKCIYAAAKKHGQDQTKRDFTGHTGSDGSAPWDRIRESCKDISMGNENLVGTTDPSVREAVILLLIDSGIANRGHRYNTLDKSWTHVAIYYNGEIAGITNSWIQNYAYFK